MSPAEREATLYLGALLCSALRRIASDVQGPYAEALRYWSRQIECDLELHRTRTPEEVLALLAMCAVNRLRGEVVTPDGAP